MGKTAYLKSQDGMTLLAINDSEYLFPAPKGLLYYAAVRNWDHGYLVVTARYAQEDAPIEEYLDLKYMLDSMDYDADAIIDQIDSIEIHPDQVDMSDSDLIDLVAGEILDRFRPAFEELAK